MKCPHCSEETQAGKVCERCGKDLEPHKGMEIEYKEFKVSELLDIKMTKPGPAGQTMKKPADRQEKRNSFRKDPSTHRRKPGKMTAGWAAAAVIITLALIAGYYLLRFLFKF